MKIRLKNIKLILLIVMFIAAGIFLLFNDSGIIKYFKLKSEVNNLHNEISRIEKENQVLQSEIDSLKNKVPAKIEKVAREKYGMIRKGETAIEVKEK